MKIDQKRLLKQIFRVLGERIQNCSHFERASQLCFKWRSGLFDVALLGRIEFFDYGYRVSIEPEDGVVVDDETLSATLEFIAKANYNSRGSGKLVYDFERQTISAVSFLCCVDEPGDQMIVESIEEPTFLLARGLGAFLGEKGGWKKRPSQKK